MEKKPLTIFVPHCSDMLTDYLPHGDGLIAHGFITHLARRGHRLHVAAEMVRLREPIHPNVTIYELPLKSSNPVIRRTQYMIGLRSLLRKLRKDIPFDLIHQLNPVFAGLSLSSIGSGLPLVLGTYVARWPHEIDPAMPRSWMAVAGERCRDLIARLQQTQADAILLTTPAASNRLPSEKSVQDRIYFLPHGLDTDLFSPAPAANVGEASVRKPGGQSILFFANLMRRKGILTLIDAFPAIARECPGVTLRIAGDGPEMPEVEKRVAALSCAAQVEFLGRQERANAPALYRDCSVYCLPSFGEPYGTTLIEAMSCGKAVVVTDCGGPRHIVSPEGGISVPAGDASRLSKALVELLRDPERCRAMGMYNRRVVETTMSWDRVTAKLEAIYESVLSKREGGRAREKLAAASERG